MACPSLQPLPCWLRQRGNLFLVVLGIFLMLVFKSRPKNSTCHPRRGRPGSFRAARASPVCPDTPARRSRHLCFVRHPTSTASDAGSPPPRSRFAVWRGRNPLQTQQTHRRTNSRPTCGGSPKNHRSSFDAVHQSKLIQLGLEPIEHDSFVLSSTHAPTVCSCGASSCKQLCERRRACQATMPLNIFEVGAVEHTSTSLP